MAELTPHLPRLREAGGASQIASTGIKGTRFAVWAPNAELPSASWVTSTTGSARRQPLTPRWDQSGIWELFVPGVGPGARLQVHVRLAHAGFRRREERSVRLSAASPRRVPHRSSGNCLRLEANIEWLRNRGRVNALDAPWSIYEVHLGSWRRVPEDGNRSLNYRELAPQAGRLRARWASRTSS
jgi:1,4-alpha-glucan branching enzyme